METPHESVRLHVDSPSRKVQFPYELRKDSTRTTVNDDGVTPLLSSLFQSVTNLHDTPGEKGNRERAVSMSMSKFEQNVEGINKFNRINTWLANERTWLAWVRTAVSLIGFGIVILKLDDDIVTQILGCILAFMGILSFLLGSLRYDVMRDIIDGTTFVVNNEFGRPGIRKFAYPLFLLFLGAMIYYVVKIQLNPSLVN